MGIEDLHRAARTVLINVAGPSSPQQYLKRSEVEEISINAHALCKPPRLRQQGVRAIDYFVNWSNTLSGKFLMYSMRALIAASRLASDKPGAGSTNESVPASEVKKATAS